MVVTIDYRFNDEWILNSGCAYHICHYRDWFTTYEHRDSNSVLLGNDASCQTVGIGTVRIRTKNGVVRTLSNVQHVQELKKNIISLGSLDSAGHMFSTQGGTMKISRGSLIMMKGKRVKDIYILQGNTVTGSAFQRI